MAYNFATDLLGLWRRTSGGMRAATVPGLDYVTAALVRAGMFTVSVSTTAPITNQATTVWFVPFSGGSYAAEGAVYLWDVSLAAYMPATPALWRRLLAPSGSFVLAASAVRVPLTGTVAETTLATIAVPAGLMSLNGRLRITVQWGKVGVANTWTPRVKFGGTTFLQFAAFGAANLSARQQAEIANRGAANSQVGSALAQGDWSQSAGAVVTAAIDTTVAQNILLTGQLANAADTMALESYLVEFIGGAG